jgi:hypothetical protein
LNGFAYTRIRDVCSEILRRYTVKKVEFSQEKVPIAFFRAPSPVVSVCCAGDKVAVGCQSGAVLTLHAAWLTDGGAA